jgi:CRP-like cAMP-binding protein
MNLLLKNIAKHVTLTAQEEERVLLLTKVHSYKSKTVLLKANEVCTQSYFVTKGILRSYTIDDNGVEHVVSFACPEWWIADMYSYLSHQKSQLFIEVNEDAEVITLTKENQERLYIEIPKMERFFRILIENSLIAHQQRLINNLSFTAEVRYEKFSKKFQSILPFLPQKQIASYIGVTPEFFSKMKAKKLKK